MPSRGKVLQGLNFTFWHELHPILYHLSLPTLKSVAVILSSTRPTRGTCNCAIVDLVISTFSTEKVIYDTKHVAS